MNWRREPDVVLKIESNSGRYLVGVEAKYRSGKSGKADDAEVENRANSLARMQDQLAEEWADLVGEAKTGTRPVLVYLTAHVGCPSEEIQASFDEYCAKFRDVSAPLIYWLSWRELPELFRGDPNRILADVARMAEQMGLTFFQGFTPVESICPHWVFAEPTGR
jgi:hypothetical protein